MHLDYLPLTFNIKFNNPVIPDTDILFILRSMLGKNLRQMSCVAQKETKCASCIFNTECAYSFIFETVISKENNIHAGTNRSSHPFVLQGEKLLHNKPIQQYSFTIFLMGKGIDYATYIYQSFFQAGVSGLFHSRVQYNIESFSIDNNSFKDIDSIDLNKYKKTWQFNTSSNSENLPKEILVEFKTPLRFKTKGNYSKDFTAQEFFSCLYRRMTTLCTLYSDSDIEVFNKNEDIKIYEQNIKWEDSRHYSARQKSAIQMGGFTGNIKLSGNFTQNEINLLEFARIFNAGKNTNFGLGQIDYWIKSRSKL